MCPVVAKVYSQQSHGQLLVSKALFSRKVYFLKSLIVLTHFSHSYVGAYISETSEKHLRKRIGMCQSLQVSFGYIISHSLGYFFGWRLTCFVMVAITTFSSALIVVLPETPYWLIEKDRHEEAQ